MQCLKQRLARLFPPAPTQSCVPALKADTPTTKPGSAECFNPGNDCKDCCLSVAGSPSVSVSCVQNPPALWTRAVSRKPVLMHRPGQAALAGWLQAEFDANSFTVRTHTILTNDRYWPKKMAEEAAHHQPRNNAAASTTRHAVRTRHRHPDRSALWLAFCSAFRYN